MECIEQAPSRVFTHLKTPNPFNINRLLRCCVLLKNENIIKVTKWARLIKVVQQISDTNEYYEQIKKIIPLLSPSCTYNIGKDCASS